MANRQEQELGAGVNQVRLDIGGNLKVMGWGRQAIAVDTDDDEALLRRSDEMVVVNSGSDCVVSVPTKVSLVVDVGGDAIVEGVQGEVRVLSIGGNLRVQSVGGLRAAEVAGDLAVEGADGAVQVGIVGGNAVLHNTGDVVLDEVRGDLHAQQLGSMVADQVRGVAVIDQAAAAVNVNAAGDVHVRQAGGHVAVNSGGNAQVSQAAGASVRISARGDIAVHQASGIISANAGGNIDLTNVAGKSVRANAKGDIRCRFQEEVGAQVKIVCGGDLHVEGSERSIHRSRGVYRFTAGSGEVVLALVAGGNVVLWGVSVDESELRGVGDDMSVLGVELGGLGVELGRELGAVGRDIARDINRKLKRQLKTKLRAAAREWADARSWNIDSQDVPPSQSPFGNVDVDVETEEAGSEPVSDEERMMILHMLEEGKVTAAEAEKLLTALGDSA